MQDGTRTTNHSTREYLTYGAIGLELDRANERRERDWAASEQLIPARTLNATRQRLGAWLIGLGTHIAGAPAAAPATR